jgi:hypothetical protein
MVVVKSKERSPYMYKQSINKVSVDMPLLRTELSTVKQSGRYAKTNRESMLAAQR